MNPRHRGYHEGMRTQGVVRVLGRGAWLVAGCLLTACPSDPFVCSDDTQCSGAPGGRCEPNGACSFPDAACPTGRRYGDEGTSQLAGQCVPPGEGGSTGPSTTATGGGDTSTGAGTSVGSESGSTGVGETSGDTSSGETTAEGTGSSSGTASSSSTGHPGPPSGLYEPCSVPEDCETLTCTLVYTLDLDPFASFCTAAECEDPALDCTDPGTGATPVCVTLSLNGGPGEACGLGCEDSGTAGCPEGMVCIDYVKNQPALCYHMF